MTFCPHDLKTGGRDKHKLETQYNDELRDRHRIQWRDTWCIQGIGVDGKLPEGTQEKEKFQAERRWKNREHYLKGEL